MKTWNAIMMNYCGYIHGKSNIILGQCHDMNRSLLDQGMYMQNNAVHEISVYDFWRLMTNGCNSQEDKHNYWSSVHKKTRRNGLCLEWMILNTEEIHSVQATILCLLTTNHLCIHAIVACTEWISPVCMIIHIRLGPSVFCEQNSSQSVYPLGKCNH